METLGPYDLLAELGRGGMGVVYRARRNDLNREFALKVILQGDNAPLDAVARFRREAQAAARLASHPGIVGVHDIGEENGRVFFAMDLVEGQSLEQRLDAGPLAPAEAARILEHAARAIAHAHREGILHRDLKPGNVLVGYDGVTRVSDFGLAVSQRAEEATERLTLSGVVLGTPSYMPPEQARGAALDPRADVYALGATLYEAVLGEPPFDGDSLYQIIHAVLRDEPVPPRRRDPRIPRDLETIVMRCLEKDPAHRYPTAEALADDLARFQHDEPIHARRPSMMYRVRKAARRHPAVVAAALLAAATFGGYFGGPGWVAVTSPSGVETRTIWPAVTHEIAGSWPDHQLQRAAVAVRPWSTVTWTPPLVLDYGFVDARSTPSGAAVRVFVSGAAPIEAITGGERLRVPVGTHRIEVSLAGFETVSDAVTVPPGGAGTIEKQLVPRRGDLSFTCWPSAVQMTLIPEREADGAQARAVYSLPIAQLPIAVGRYRVQLRKENHFPRETRLEVPMNDSGIPVAVTAHASLSPIARWTQRLNGECVAAPVVADFNDDNDLDIAWVTRDGWIEVFHGRDGEPIWRRNAGSGIVAAPALASVDGDGVPDLLVINNQRRFIALSGRDGRELWSRTLPSSVQSAPVVGDIDGTGSSVVVTAGAQGIVRMSEVATGEPRWEMRLPADADTPPSLVDVNGDGRHDVLVSDLAGDLRALSGVDGAVLWTLALGETSDAPPALYDLDGDGTLEAVLGTWLGDLLAVELRTGKIRWKRRCTHWEQPVATMWAASPDAAPLCVVSDSGGFIRLLDGRTGEIQWTTEVAGGTWGAPIVTDADNDGHPECYVATLTGSVHALDVTSGSELWRYSFRSLLRAPLTLADIEADGTPELLLTPVNGHVAVLRTVPPPELWRRRFAWQPRTPQLFHDLDDDGVRDVLFDDVGALRVISGRTGAALWSTQLGQGVNSPLVIPDVDGDGVPECFVESMERACLLAGATGAIRWRSPALWDEHSDGGRRTLTASGGPSGNSGRLVYLLSPLGRLHCFAASDGKQQWATQEVVENARALIVRDVNGDGMPDAICVGANGRAVALDGRDRRVLWTAAAPAPVQRCTGALELGPKTGTVFVLAAPREYRVLRVRDGTTLWHSRAFGHGAGVNAVAVHDGDADGERDLLVSEGGGRIALRAAATGRALWSTTLSLGQDQWAPEPISDRDGDGTGDVLVNSSEGILVRSGRTGQILFAGPPHRAWGVDGEHLLATESAGREILRTPLPALVPGGLRTRLLGDHAGAARRLAQELVRARTQPVHSSARNRVAARPHRTRLGYLMAMGSEWGTLQQRLGVFGAARAEGLRSAETDASWLKLQAQSGSVTGEMVAALHPDTALRFLDPGLEPAQRRLVREAAATGLGASPHIGLLLLAGELERAEAAIERIDPFAWSRFAWQALLLLEHGRPGDAARCHALAAAAEPYDLTLQQLGQFIRRAPKPAGKR